MDQTSIVEKLESKFGPVTEVRPGVFKASESFKGRNYAVRYFQLHANVFDIAGRLNAYQEDLMAETFFDPEVPADLRWNHYLYLLTDANAFDSFQEFSSVKAQIEGDRAYSRKVILTEAEFEEMLLEEPVEVSPSLPVDVSHQWIRHLEERELSFILDDQISAPQSARLIKEGYKKSYVPPSDVSELSGPEGHAGNQFLTTLKIESFRSYPSQKTFEFGDVNLIFGANGVGKTSLLEAIEYLYCGGNKRSGENIEGVAVTGRFIGSEDEMVTSSSTNAAILRARNAHWYSKIDVRKPSLIDSFAKFNFLDTDAAVHLSTSNDSEERLKNDIARLLLGTEVEKMSSRLARVGEKLKEEIRCSNKNVEVNEAQLLSAEERLKSELKSPKMSDGLYVDLCHVLEKCGWLTVPESKDLSVEFREALHSASSAAKEIETRSSKDVTLEPGLISEMIVERELNLKEAEDLSERIKKILFEKNDALRQEESLKKSVSRFRTLLEYARSGFTKKLSEKSVLRDQYENMRERLSLVDSELRGFPRELDLEVDLHEAYQSCSGKIGDLKERVTSLGVEVKTLESTMESVAVFKQRLLSAASEIISNTHDREHCPLCQTRFEAEELEERMGMKFESVEEKMLLDAQKRLEDASKTLAREEHIFAVLEKLKKFVGPQRSLTIKQAIESFKKTKATLDQVEKDISKLDEELKYLERNGLSESDLHKLLFESQLDTLPTSEDLESMHSDVESLLEQNFANQEKLKTDLSLAEEEISKLTDIPTGSEGASPDRKIQGLRDRIADLDNLHSAVAALDSLLKDFRSIGKGSLRQQLEQARGLAERLELAVQSELYSDQTLQKLKDEVFALRESLDAERRALSKLNEADALIDTMVNQLKEGTLADQVLRSNAADISAIFSTIHAPNEFKVDVSNGGSLNLTRVESNENVSLTQMSTGQRAAYALSLFLSMNKSLVAGPPVILMDDPIAHIDDLNILSFLDHLRDIAIAGSRQIFLATADAKLAGLFRQKFRFMGDARFREFKLAR